MIAGELRSSVVVCFMKVNFIAMITLNHGTFLSDLKPINTPKEPGR